MKMMRNMTVERCRVSLLLSMATRCYATQGSATQNSPLSKDTFKKPISKSMQVTGPEAGMGTHPTLDPHERLEPNVPTMEPLPNTLLPRRVASSSQSLGVSAMSHSLSTWPSLGYGFLTHGYNLENMEEGDTKLAKAKDMVQKAVQELKVSIPDMEKAAKVQDDFETTWEEGKTTEDSENWVKKVVALCHVRKRAEVEDVLKSIVSLRVPPRQLTPIYAQRLLSSLDANKVKALQRQLLMEIGDEAPLLLDPDATLMAQWEATKGKSEMRCYSNTAAYFLSLLQAMVSTVVLSSDNALDVLPLCTAGEIRAVFGMIMEPLLTKTANKADIFALAQNVLETLEEGQIEVGSAILKALMLVRETASPAAPTALFEGNGLLLFNELSTNVTLTGQLLKHVAAEGRRQEIVSRLEEALTFEDQNDSVEVYIEKLIDKKVGPNFMTTLRNIMADPVLLEYIANLNDQTYLKITLAAGKHLSELMEKKKGTDFLEKSLEGWVRGTGNMSNQDYMAFLRLYSEKVESAKQIILLSTQKAHRRQLHDFLKCRSWLQGRLEEEHPHWMSLGIINGGEEIDKKVSFALTREPFPEDTKVSHVLGDSANDDWYGELRRNYSYYEKLVPVEPGVHLSASVRKLCQLKSERALQYCTFYDARLHILQAARDILFRCTIVPNRITAALESMHRRRVGPVGKAEHEHNVPVEVGHCSYHDMTTFRKYDMAGWYQRLMDVQHRNVSLRVRLSDLRAPSHLGNAPLLCIQGERRLRILAGERVSNGIFKLDSDRYEDYNDNWEYGATKICQALAEAKKADLGPEYWPTVDVKVRRASGRRRMMDSLVDWKRIDEASEANYKKYRELKSSGTVYVSPTLTWFKVSGMIRTAKGALKPDERGYSTNTPREAYMKMMEDRKKSEGS